MDTEFPSKPTEIAAAVHQSLDDAYYSTGDVKRFAEEDLDFFGSLVLPEVVTMDFPKFYIQLFQMLRECLIKERDFSKFAIGFPRGHGKTMFLKLIIVYIILYTKRKYVLVIGANIGKAEAILSDVCDMLDSYNVQETFGGWRYDLEKDTKDLKKFSFNGRPVILQAAGYGTAIRGSNEKNSRPDVMIFDDAQTKECAESLVEAQKYINWFLGTALKAKNPTGCTYLYVGNMYKDMEIRPNSGIYGCMLRNLQRNPSWTSFIVGAILEDFTALWEELQPLEQLLAEFREDLALGQPEIFFAEVLNDPQANTSYFIELDKIVVTERHQDDAHQGCYIVIDPATNKATPDQMVFGVVHLYDGLPQIHHVEAGKYSGPESVYKGIELAMQHGASLIVVEANAYQYSLIDWFQFAFGQLNLNGLAVEPLYTKGVSKNSRILQMFRDVAKAKLAFSRQAHSLVLSQAAVFDPRRSNNVDDILDMCEMATQVPAKFGHLIAVPGDLSIDTQLHLRGIQDLQTAPPPLPF